MVRLNIGTMRELDFGSKGPQTPNANKMWHDGVKTLTPQPSSQVLEGVGYTSMLNPLTLNPKP